MIFNLLGLLQKQVIDKTINSDRVFKQLLVFLSILCSEVVTANDEMDAFFAMSPEQLANIFVTIATGTKKTVYQSASVTTVITAEQIKTMGATELNQVLETVPGLHVRIQAITNDAVYSMRGIANDINAQVLILLNGTRFTNPMTGSALMGMELPVEAIQQIEIIRGPGSALYGADAFAGVINIITKKAKNIAGTEVGIRGGSWDTQSIWGLHGDEWLGWDIAATLQYAHNNNDGDRIINSDVQSQIDAMIGTSASLAPNEVQNQAERWNAHLNLQRKHWDVSFWAFNTDDGGLRSGISGALDNKGRFDNENYLADVHFSSEDLIDNWEISAHTSYLYANVDIDTHNFPNNTLLPIDINGYINPTGNFVFFPDGLRTHTKFENQVVAFEVGSLFKGFKNNLLKLTAGYRYEQVKTEEQRNFGFGVIDGSTNTVDGSLTDVTGTPLVLLPNSHRSIWSVSLQDEWAIAPNWSLTAGLRYDNYSDFGSTFNPRFALVWAISEQFNAKLLYGRAFRAPNFLEQKQQNNQIFIGNPNLKPETIETVELAFDYRPLSSLRLASNFYFYEIDDLIEPVASIVSEVTVNNTTGQTGYGAEFEWDWQPRKQWNLKGNYAWQHAKNKKTHRRIYAVPEHQVYVAVAWYFGGGSNLLFHLIKLGEIENLYHHTQMKCYQEISCPNCRCSTLMKSGRNAEGIQRYRCKNSACPTQTFMLDYRYNACMLGVKEKVVEMAINSSGIRDTARVLKINKNTVISILKSKEDSLVQVNPIFLSQQAETPLDVRLELVCEEAELDEQWSFVGKKSNQRWLWHAVDHATNTVIAYVFGKRKDDVFKELKTLLTPFNISRYYTDDWGAYERNLETNEHEIGKRNTQKIERKNLNFRTWIKRLTRRTICFSKIEKMHDIVIGLLINKVEFGRNIHA